MLKAISTARIAPLGVPATPALPVPKLKRISSVPLFGLAAYMLKKGLGL